MIFHIRPFLLFLVLSVSFSLKAKEQPFGCLIHEAYGPDTYVLSNGTVSQSFKPCSTGELVYVHLFLNSTDNSTFSAQMSISEYVEDQLVVLAKQQIIVPENSKDPFVSIPLASSVDLKEGQEYWINIEANHQHPLNISYSTYDDYEGGSAFRNGAKTKGDLAFELGIRFAEEKPLKKTLFQIAAKPSNCIEKSSSGNTPIDAEFENWHLQWTPCEEIGLNSLALQVISEPGTKGLLSVYRITELNNYISIYDQPITINDTEEKWQVMMLEDIIVLEKGVDYHFEFHALETWNTTFLGNPKNHRESKFNYWINPIKFNSWEASKGNDFSCSASTEKVSALHNSSNEMLIQPFTACTDGYLKTTIVAGELNKNDVLNWFIRDQNELILDEGEVGYKEYNEGLITISTDVPVLGNVQYDLVLVSNPEMNSSIYLAEAEDGIKVANSDLVELNKSLMVQFEFEELEIELAEDIELSKTEMSVFPNPFTDRFQVNIKGIDEECTLALYDFAGNQVWSARMEPSEKMLTVANIDSSLPKGYYTLRMDYKSSVVLETLIKN